MKFSAFRKYTIILFALVALLGFRSITNNFTSYKFQQTYASSPIQHIFIIAMENHDWRDIKGSSQAPYINKTLLPMGAHAEQYYNPPNNHPSAPNYVWLEAGAAVAGANDCKPTDNGCSSSANHLSKLLDAASISWKEYAEDSKGTSCILDFSGADVNHVGFSYFTDVTNNNNPNSSNCIAHERPYSELATALQNNTVPRYAFITPNVNDDMHDGTIQQGDTWLSQQVPVILNSQAYKNGGVLFITWDEGEGDDGPIGMIVESSYAKKNYANTIHYDHSSTLKTLEEIFGVGPLLGGATKATDLSDLFTVPLTGTGGTNPVPTTVYCVGGNAQPPCATIPPSGNTNNPIPSTTAISPAVSVSPVQNPCPTNTQAASVHIKEHTRQNGAISNLLLLLLQFLIQLLQQLLGGTITLPTPGTPTPTQTFPSGTPSTNPSTAPTVNPCVSPTTQNVSMSPSGSTLHPTSALQPTSGPAPTSGTNASCVTSAPQGRCPSNGYYTDPQIIGGTNPWVNQNIWGAQGTNYQQTLHANGAGDWYITASVSNNSSGAVLTFPNTGWSMPTKTIDSYATITSSWNVTIPTDNKTSAGWAAYDLWFNNWADEVMIQTDIVANSNYNCSSAANTTINGQLWHLCDFGSERVVKPGRDDNNLRNETSGSVDVKAVLQWLEKTGHLPANSKWTAGSFGFEVTNTSGTTQTFKVNGFTWTSQ